MLKRLVRFGLTRKSFNWNPVTRIHCSRLMMSGETPFRGLPLATVVTNLEQFAAKSLAASWDNVGLLVEPTDEKLVSKILLTNDLTEDVMDEAIELKTDLIVSYHPMIFAPLKSVTNRCWKERIVAKCLENKIAVYSPHTAFDSIKGGVNDWLASAFEEVLSGSKPIQPDSNNPAYGMGRLCDLNTRISIEEAVEMIKKRTNLQHVRLARGRRTDGFVGSVAVCAGSGQSVLKGVPADLYVTGEMSHHDLLDAIHDHASVILTNHSDSERGFLKEFASTLRNLLGEVQVRVSEVDADPLKTV